MTYAISIDELCWEEHGWKKFCKYARKKYRKLSFPEIPIVEVLDDTDHLSELEANILVKGILSEYMDEKIPLERYKPMNISSNKLPIETDVIADTYLFLSLKLAILQTDQICLSILDQFFLNIKMNFSPFFWHFYDFDEELMTLLDIHGIKYKEISVNGICDLVKRTINDGKYITVHMDEFYISRKESFERLHLVRENLVYGYDDKRKIFNVFGFGKREKTEAFEISYDEMVLSFEKGRLFHFNGAGYLKLEGCYPVTIISISNNEIFELTEEYLYSRLKEFLYPNKKVAINGEVQIYGFDVYGWILEELEGKTDRETVDYRTFHLLYEHKKNIYRCLRKLNEKSGTISENQIEKYERVVNAFNRLRIMYMKEAGISERLIRTKKIFKANLSNDRFRNEFIDSVNTEKQVLEDILS